LLKRLIDPSRRWRDSWLWPTVEALWVSSMCLVEHRLTTLYDLMVTTGV
jgi:hypothetical protein